MGETVIRLEIEAVEEQAFTHRRERRILDKVG